MPFPVDALPSAQRTSQVPAGYRDGSSSYGYHPEPSASTTTHQPQWNFDTLNYDGSHRRSDLWDASGPGTGPSRRHNANVERVNVDLDNNEDDYIPWSWSSPFADNKWANVSDFDIDSPPPEPFPHYEPTSHQHQNNTNSLNTSQSSSRNRPTDTSTQMSNSFGMSEPIDLTQDSSSPPSTTHSSPHNSQHTSRKRPAAALSARHTSPSDPSSKRPRLSSNSQSQTQSQQQRQPARGGGETKKPRTIEEIDLIEDDDIGAVLQKQRAETVRNQQEQNQDGNPSSKLKSFQCTVCLDTPTDLTATACGHAFCRSCLMDWLVAGEKDHPRRSNCPACRKMLNRTTKRSTKDVIPLEIMTRSAKGRSR